MKKLILAVAVACMALPAMAQYEEKFPSYIQVNGRAEKEITPNEFYLTVVINERDSKGKISVEQQQKEMIAKLRALGIDTEKQLKVADMSSQFYRRNTSTATAQYQLLLHSGAEVAKVYGALSDMGISNVNIERVSHSNLKQYKEQVRTEAMQNAKQSAEALAAAIGQKIGACFYIYDSNSDLMPYYDMPMFARAKMADNSAVGESVEQPLDFKTIKLNYNVQTKFILQ